MKIKKMTLMLMALALLAVTSVGFAAWVITGDFSDDADGNIKIEDVIDRRVNAEIELLDDGGNALTDVNFGKPSGASTGWLAPDSKVIDEALDKEIKVTINNWDVLVESGVNYTLSIKVEVVDDKGVTKDISSLVSDKLIEKLPEFTTVDLLTISESTTSANDTLTANDETKGKLTITEATEDTDAYATFVWDIKFSWGEAFNKTNPYTYYNEKEVDGCATTGCTPETHKTETHTTYGDEALENLKTLYNTLNGCKYKVTVEVKEKTA